MDNTNIVVLPVEQLRELIETTVCGCIEKVIGAFQPKHDSDSVDIEGALEFLNSNGYWKTQARMTPAAKVDLTPENNLFLTPEEFGRRGQFYFGLSAFEGFELTDAFAGERDTVCGVDDAVEDGIRHCGVADGVVPVQFGEL